MSKKLKIEKDDHYDLHFFICTNSRDNGEDCAHKGAESIQKELKKWSKHEDFHGKKIRINKAGCLDRCKQGVACVSYPKGEWILEAREDDVNAIKEAILKQLGQND